MRILSKQFLMSKKSPYRFVDYLESTGTQYINTGISNMNVFGYEVKYQSTGIYNQNTSVKFDGIFGINGANGAGTTADTKIWYNFSNPSAVFNNIYCRSASFSTPPSTTEAYYANPHIASVKNKVVMWDGITLGSIESFETPIASGSLHLFGVCYPTSTSQYRSKTRIFYFKAFDINGNILGNFKPCVRIADNVAGMYDTISKQFFTNRGTNNFIIGE